MPLNLIDEFAPMAVMVVGAFFMNLCYIFLFYVARLCETT